MSDATIEKLFDVLQNIEAAILDVYDTDATLLDLDVMDALDALQRRYAAEEQGRTPPALRLSERARHVYDSMERICAWRLGHGELNEGDAASRLAAGEASSIDDVLASLKRIRKSVRLWNEQGGRQGYLEYVRQFLPQSTP